MTTPVAQQEADGTQVVFEAALLAIGVSTLEDALALWAHLPAPQTAQVAAAWLDQAVHLVLARRSMSRDLAVAYYRLARALRTGTTIPDPYNPIPTSVTMEELRYEFQRAVDAAHGNAPAVSPSDAVDSPSPTPDNPQTSQADSGGSASGNSGGDTVPIEPIEDLEQLDSDLADSAAEEARTVLAALGPIHETKLNQKIDTTLPADQVDVQRKDAHDRAGSRQAAAAERVALNGGRGVVFALAEKDPRVIGWVRASRTGTPCGFCAMLISRGLVLYGQHNVFKNKEGVLYLGKTSDAPTVQDGSAEEGDLYHDNCHCYAEPVYSVAQYNSNPVYDLNREYSVLWPKVTEGLSGNDALNAWRKYIEGRNSDATTTHPANAQAA